VGGAFSFVDLSFSLQLLIVHQFSGCVFYNAFHPIGSAEADMREFVAAGLLITPFLKYALIAALRFVPSLKRHRNVTFMKWTAKKGAVVPLVAGVYLDPGWAIQRSERINQKRPKILSCPQDRVFCTSSPYRK
jgi:hypothetical protein